MSEESGTSKIKQDNLLPSRRPPEETFSQEDIDELAGFLGEEDDEDTTGPFQPADDDDTGSFKPVKD